MEQKNLVWLVYDSMRSDRTSLGNHKRETTPNLEQLATNPDTIGTTAISHAIWSLPSVASMLTGLYPSRHGTGLHNDVLPSQIRTIPEQLSNNGFHTAGISVNPYFSNQTNLDRGFDKFEYFDISSLVREAGLQSFASFIWNIRRYSAGFSTVKRKHSPDYLLTEVAKQHLTKLSNSSRPFAFFAHFHGAHHPYYPSPEFRGEFEMDESIKAVEAVELAFDRTSNPYVEMAEDSISDSEWQIIRIMYDSLIRQVDSLIGHLVDHIDDLGLDQNTIVVITSDHGDLLGEYDLMSHKLVLHDGLISVPLVVRGSDQLSAIEMKNNQVQHIDVMQTILDELGVPTNNIHGVNLSEESREFTITQRGGETAEKTLAQIRENNKQFKHKHILPGLVTTLRMDDWKLVCGDDTTELYNIPNEMADLSNEHPNITKKLRSKFDNWMEIYGDPIYTNQEAGYSEDTKQRLSDLGYIVD